MLTKKQKFQLREDWEHRGYTAMQSAYERGLYNDPLSTEKQIELRKWLQAQERRKEKREFNLYDLAYWGIVISVVGLFTAIVGIVLAS